MGYGFTDMTASKHNNHWGWQNGFHIDLHLTATDAHIAAGWVGHVISEKTRLAIFE